MNLSNLAKVFGFIILAVFMYGAIVVTSNSALAATPENNIIACFDGEDNDEDGSIDLNDPECVALLTPPEEPEAGTENTEQLCSNGIDDDGDFLVDLVDLDCAEFVPDDEEEIAPITPEVVEEEQTRGSRSGGRSSRPISAVLGVSTDTEGQVLGASTTASFVFANNLSFGMRVAEVVELQERLRAEGFFTFPTSTGYFGPITLASVKAYQTAKGIPFITGFVGPLTRAELNK